VTAELAINDYLPFREVWLVDFEFGTQSGERPEPRCLVAQELRSGRLLRLWEDELLQMKESPYSVADDSLFVAYFASAEMGCHLALGWPLPKHILDLYVAFRTITNGLSLPCGAGLLGALVYFGLDAMDAIEKNVMRELALRGGPWTADEKQALLDYCEEDVRALRRLLTPLLGRIDLRRVIYHSRYMKSVARMEHVGTPIDAASLSTLRSCWSGIQDALIRRTDAQYGVFDGRTFKQERFAGYLARKGFAWPRTESGELARDEATFREMVKVYPEVALLGSLLHSLGQLRLEDLAVGKDGRNRCLLSPFRAKTGRNQPSNTRFIFGPSVWLRSLIQPPLDFGLAYIDWSQQEIGIAAALSGDAGLLAAYQSGDCYLQFGKQAGRIPPDGTRESHEAVREQCKQCMLGVQYLMSEVSLALRIDATVAHARELLRMHRATYPRFWAWSESALNHAMLLGRLHTVFGWTIHVDDGANRRSVQNFPMQANGAEMLRLACFLATERGVQVCAPVHDALLIVAPLDDLDHAVWKTQQAMAEASSIVLDGFVLRSEPKVIRHPDRYSDKRGKDMWATVWEEIRNLGAMAGVHSEGN
jgi:hypothetical protein